MFTQGKITGPYIGITGFTKQEDVREMLNLMLASSRRLLMVGVLASYKTICGLVNGRPGRYPTAKRIAGIFINHPKALNLVHYATDYPGGLFGQLNALAEIGGFALHGFQLNIAWPPIADLEDWFQNNLDKFLLLQIGLRAMKFVDESPKKLADMVGHYVPMIDAVLIDPSGGRGELFDAKKVRDYFRELKSRGWPIGLGVAGGLGPNTLHILEPLVEEFPDLSWDAEGCLRTPKPEDALSLPAAAGYLTGSLRLSETPRII